jgi:cholesterol oxidase
MSLWPPGGNFRRSLAGHLQTRERLGHSYSGNGDFLSFALECEPACEPNFGPVITQRTDYNLFQNFNRDHAFILEDASYGAILAWFAEGAKPSFLNLGSLHRFVRHLIARLTARRSFGSIGWALGDVLSGDVSFHTCVLLCMGLDKSNGVMTLDNDHHLTIDWPYRDSLPLYNAIRESCKQFAYSAKAKIFNPLPNWF